jgi:hypothetical protein
MSKAETEKKRRVTRERQLAEDWQAIAQTPAGRRVIADLMAWGWVFQPLESNDPLELSRLNGERNFALRVARYLNLMPEIFAEAMREHDEVQSEWMGQNEYRQFMAKFLTPGPVMNS